MRKDRKLLGSSYNYFLVTTVLVYYNKLVAMVLVANSQEQTWDRWFHLDHDRMDMDIAHWNDDLRSLPPSLLLFRPQILFLLLSDLLRVVG
jgi:hypothetical protein